MRLRVTIPDDYPTESMLGPMEERRPAYVFAIDLHLYMDVFGGTLRAPEKVYMTHLLVPVIPFPTTSATTRKEKHSVFVHADVSSAAASKSQHINSTPMVSFP